MDLKEEAALGGSPSSHWYYRSKGRAIKAMIGSAPLGEILDVGAGSGVFTRLLVEDGQAEHGTCVDPFYSDQWLAENTHPKIDFVRVVEASPASLVLMIDVLEHVDDDVELLSDYVARVAPGTRFMISVPAFEFLWSPHDDFLEHRRRYTLARLRRTVDRAGLDVITDRYFFGALFPAVAAQRMVQNAGKSGKAPQTALKPAPDWLNTLLIGVHDLERTLLFPFNRVAGVSAFCLARKP